MQEPTETTAGCALPEPMAVGTGVWRRGPCSSQPRPTPHTTGQWRMGLCPCGGPASSTPPLVAATHCSHFRRSPHSQLQSCPWDCPLKPDSSTQPGPIAEDAPLRLGRVCRVVAGPSVQVSVVCLHTLATAFSSEPPELPFLSWLTSSLAKVLPQMQEHFLSQFPPRGTDPILLPPVFISFWPT